MATDQFPEYAKLVHDTMTANFRAGCKDALLLAIGHESSGGDPYPGGHSPEFMLWVSSALERLEEA
jgi:hypothetical protein